MIKLSHRLFVILLVNFSFLYAQSDSLKESYPRFGISLGYGNQVIKIFGGGVDLNVNYLYEVYLFEANYITSLYSGETWNVESLLNLVYGYSNFKSNINNPEKVKSSEISINSGFLIKKNIWDDGLKIYFASSIGLIYAEALPERQKSGFMFCGNYSIGLQIKLDNSHYLDLRTGFRHISNAGLKRPNGGINNWMVNFGTVFIIP